jgi:Dolichyl-phosphate-mannose-protein mannosyltransferase
VNALAVPEGAASEPVTLRSGSIIALGTIAFLYPILLCAIFFPTPSGDLREYINLGLTFPLHTWKHPPLQTWTAGVVALTGARDTWAFVVAAQLVNAIGLVYLALTARTFIGRGAVVPLVILYCGSLFYSAATPSMAINADQLQVPLWAGVLYHALAAARNDRWPDWLACGALAGVAFLAKYFAAVLLAALLAAALIEPAYRKIFRNPRFYVAGLVSAAILAVHVVPEIESGDDLAYAARTFDLLRDPVSRADSLWHLARGFVFYGAPAFVVLAVIAWREHLRPRLPKDPAQRVIVWCACGILAIVAAMILFGGLIYTTRYSYAFNGLCLLALLCMMPVPTHAWQPFANGVLMIWAAIAVGTLVYTQLVIHRIFREPSPAAAAVLRESWDRQFTCGPAYVLGDHDTARSIANYFGRPVTGVAFDETDRTAWFDPDRRKRLGMIAVITPARTSDADIERWFAGKATQTFALPYRRTWKKDEHHYVSYFSPPQDCSAR